MRGMRTVRLSVYIAMLSATPALADSQVEIDALKEQLKKQQAQLDSLADQLESSEGKAGGARWYDKTTLGGYAEANFKRVDGSKDEFDAYRMVLFVGHQFNDKVRFASEIEVEHAYVKDNDTDTTCRVADADNSGDLQASEVTCGAASTKTSAGYLAVEQMFLEYQYLPNHAVAAGQLLIPVGIINETHEPDTYYGVFRPTIERDIIPTTWFETGMLASGDILPGFSYDVMVSAGLKAADGKFKDGRQRGAKSDGSDLAYTTRFSYTGVPGLDVGVSYHKEEDMSQGTPKVVGEDLEGELIESHVAFSRGAFGLRVLGAQWDMNDQALLAADQKRSKQQGWYVEPSWKITPSVGVFTRYSEWDTEDAADSVNSQWEEINVGVNYWLAERAVVKADWQHRDDPVAANEDQDGFNLGVGWSF